MNHLILLFSFIFGLIIGSFINCMIWRLHSKESFWGRSHCVKCKNKIAWYDNLPVISFLFLRGKCRSCRESISWQYPIVEVAVGFLFALNVFINLNTGSMGFGVGMDKFFNLFYNFNFFLTIFRDWFFISVMTIIFIYDLRWYLILDRVTLPALGILAAMNLILGFSWQNLLLAVLIGGGFFFIQFAISKGKWIGGGDIRLGLVMGAGLGWPNILVGVFLAYLIGSVAGLFLLTFKKKKWGSRVPFGVFLAIATIISLFWGDYIVYWYLNFF